MGLGFSSYVHAEDIYRQTSDIGNTLSVDTGTANYWRVGYIYASSTIQITPQNTYGSWTITNTNCGTFAPVLIIASSTATTGFYPAFSSNTVGSIYDPTLISVGETVNAIGYPEYNYTLIGGTTYGLYAYSNCTFSGEYTIYGNADIVSNYNGMFGAIIRDVATTTRITTIEEPLSGTISTSTNVIFDFQYFYNDIETPDINAVGIELINLTNQNSVFTLNTPILASGSGEYRKSYNLIANNTYSWRPFLKDDAGNYRYGNVMVFNVVSNPNPFSPLESEFATSTATSTTPVIYLNLVSLIQNKHPIAYIPQTITLLQNQATLNGTSSFPTLQFDFTNSKLGSTTLNLTTVDMFSTSTITYFFGTTQINIFKNLITAVVWVGVVLFLIRDIKRTILKSSV